MHGWIVGIKNIDDLGREGSSSFVGNKPDLTVLS